MKKLFIALTFSALASSLWALDLWRSSTTATADTNQELCTQNNGRGIFHGVIISSAGPTFSSFTIFNSTMAPTKSIGPVDSTAKAPYYYDAVLVTTNTTAGMAYTTVGTAVTTILYDCY